jgi:hypothetical protein
MIAGLVVLLAGLVLAKLTFDPAPTFGGDNTPVPIAGGIIFPPTEPPPGYTDYPGVLGVQWNPLRVILLGVGLLVCGVAVYRRLRTCTWQLEARVETAALLAVAGVGGLIAYQALSRSWDSGYLFLTAVVAVSLAAAFLVLLPTPARKAVLSVWVVYHFLGILVATTNQDPSNTRAPYVSNKLWEFAYRPYLGFLYMNNAYHFYSPDPGPPDLLWFRVQYADGKIRWVNMPERDKSPVPLHYTRLIAMGNSISAAVPINMKDNKEMENRKRDRVRGGMIKGIAPLPEVAPLQLHYQEPNFLGKLYIASYARHIMYAYPHPDGEPAVGVESVKVYHVVHDMLTPAQFVKGESPLNLTLYRPYFFGEFKPDGSFTEDGARDPFLYWLLPIIYEPSPDGSGQRLINSLDIHAGSKNPRMGGEMTP